MNRDIPPLPYLLDIEGLGGGGEAVKEAKGEEGGRYSIIIKLREEGEQ